MSIIAPELLDGPVTNYIKIKKGVIVKTARIIYDPNSDPGGKGKWSSIKIEITDVKTNKTSTYHGSNILRRYKISPVLYQRHGWEKR